MTRRHTTMAGVVFMLCSLCYSSIPSRVAAFYQIFKYPFRQYLLYIYTKVSVGNQQEGSPTSILSGLYTTVSFANHTNPYYWLYNYDSHFSTAVVKTQTGPHRTNYFLEPLSLRKPKYACAIVRPHPFECCIVRRLVTLQPTTH